MTHRHADHSGELRSFPGAKIYVNADETEAAELQGISNLVPVRFTDGAYHNFPACQKIADGVYFIKAKGHTSGNSIVVAEKDGLFYMFHGDITYVDEALYENKLSVVFDDLPAARETLDRVREFIRLNPTVYCGKYVCSVCGYVYDPDEHDGVAFEDLPEDWRCPRCRQPKEKFNRA